MSASPPSGPPQTSDSSTGDGMRRRPGLATAGAQVHYDWRVVPGGEGDDDQEGEDEMVFEEEYPTKFQEYFNIFCDYVFWILLAYCASNLLLWGGEKAGLISPQYEEWSPIRWWHTNPHEVQKELFQNATMNTGTSEQFDSLKKWIEGGPGGWVSPKLLVSDYLSERGRYDRRLEVREPVEKDEVLVRLPLSHVLSADFCQQDITDSTIRQVVDAQKRSSEPIDINPWTWITLYMIAHARKGASGGSGSTQRFDSLLKGEYIDASLSYLPVFWDDENLHWLNGTDLLDVHVLDVHAAIETEYHKLTYLVSSIESEIPIIDFKKWAMVVMSRGETVNLPDKENKTRTVPQLAIMPLIDLVDHHLPMPEQPLFTDDDLHKTQESGSRTNISYNTDLAAVVLKARENLEGKSAVTVGYGVRSNADYLLYHGFTMPREWSDLTLCTQYATIELPLPSDLPTWKSRFLAHPYRFAVPACPNHKSTPHVIVGAARFLEATEDDVVDFEKILAKDPSLVDGAVVPKENKFLGHGALEAVAAVCDINAQPPLCRTPLSLASELAAWELIRKQTVARVAKHIGSIKEDERLLVEDDERNHLTVNQRHAVIARREEKVTLQKWCAIAVHVAQLLSSPTGAREVETTRVPDSETLENDEPRVRPRYWARLVDGEPRDGAVPAECLAR